MSAIISKANNKKFFKMQLFVNGDLAQERMIERYTMKRVIEQWSHLYGLQNKDYQIFLYLPSKMNELKP